ncbi:MAG: RuvA C-terminal domain-containing protein, partial [Sideroxydans sp.]
GATSTGVVVAVSAGNDISNALLALGYNEKEADWVARQLPRDVGVSDGIRQALKLLSKA